MSEGKAALTEHSMLTEHSTLTEHSIISAGNNNGFASAEGVQKFKNNHKKLHISNI